MSNSISQIRERVVNRWCQIEKRCQIRELSAELAPALTYIYQTSLDAGTVPDDWKMAHVVPIFKKGDKSSAANYRPVSLTTIGSKVMEHILHSNIIGHFERNSILTDTQHGFRSKRSCETQLIATVQELARGMSDGHQIDAILLDFAKAFDKVPHRRLLHKLHHYGIRGPTLSWIESFLTGRKQHVLTEGAISSEAEVILVFLKAQSWAHYYSWPLLMTSRKLSVFSSQVIRRRLPDFPHY